MIWKDLEWFSSTLSLPLFSPGGVSGALPGLRRMNFSVSFFRSRWVSSLFKTLLNEKIYCGDSAWTKSKSQFRNPKSQILKCSSLSLWAFEAGIMVSFSKTGEKCFYWNIFHFFNCWSVSHFFAIPSVHFALAQLNFVSPSLNFASHSVFFAQLSCTFAVP